MSADQRLGPGIKNHHVLRVNGKPHAVAFPDGGVGRNQGAEARLAAAHREDGTLAQILVDQHLGVEAGGAVGQVQVLRADAENERLLGKMGEGPRPLRRDLEGNVGAGDLQRGPAAG